MLKTKNLLASLSLEIPALEANSEGQLRGGFSAFGAGVNPMMGNRNCDCSCEDNDNCPNNSNCNCSCTSNKNCGGCGGNKTTPATDGGTASSVSVSFLF